MSETKQTTPEGEQLLQDHFLTENRSLCEQMANPLVYSQSYGLSALLPPTLSATTSSSLSLLPMSPTNHSKSI